jgi:hypothetical protein
LNGMLRVLLGIIKGGLVGAALGYAAMRLGISGGAAAWFTYAVVGFVVGLVCGKAVWRQETLWTPALKGLFGAGVCLGLYWGAAKLFGDFRLGFTQDLGLPDLPLAQLPMLLAPLFGIVYGVFVEVDDGERKAPAEAKGKAGG